MKHHDPLFQQKIQLAKMDLSKAYSRQVQSEIRAAKRAYCQLLADDAIFRLDPKRPDTKGGEATPR